MTRRTLYYHFASKEILVGLYLERRDGMGRAMLERSAFGATTPAQKILAVFAKLEPWFLSRGFHGCALGNAVAESETIVIAGPITKRHKIALADWFVRTCASGTCADPVELGEALMLVFDGALTSATTRRDPAVARRATRVAALLMRAHGFDISP